MTISTYDDLRAWFYGNSRKGNPAPYWTLFGHPFGNKEIIITRNDVNANLDESFEWLQNTIKRVNNPEGQRFRVLQVDQPGGNNPVGQVYTQIYAQQMAGIGSLPGYGGATKQEIAEAIAAEKEKWELQRKLEDLEARINAGPDNDFWEKGMSYVERFAQTPIGQAVISKVTGIPFSAIAGAGAGEPDNETAPGDQDNEFYNNMATVAQTLGTNEYEVARKLKILVQQHPDMARQFITGS